GGFYERLVGICKLHLKRTLQNSLVTFDEFNTVLTEVENTMNTRPLTYVGDDLHEEEILTPSHLLYGHILRTIPIPEENLEFDTYNDSNKLSKRHRYILNLILKFQQRWKKDYLLHLRQTVNNSNRPKIQLGEVVLIEGDNSRLKWKLGKIVDLHTSPDGFTRSASIKTKTGIITRAIIHLYPLEIYSNTHNSSIEETSAPLNSFQRPTRRAKIVARQRIKNIITEEN
ncbi:hypothetical protein DMUE_5789, partial [Dictyocoela muelleri]